MSLTQVFRGRTLRDARSAVTAALGEDATLLTTRRVPRAGFMGMLGAQDVEVVALNDAVTNTEQPAPPVSRAKGRSPGAIFATGAYGDGGDPDSDRVRELREKIRTELHQTRALALPTQDSRALHDEVSQIRSLLDQYVAAPQAADRYMAFVHAAGYEGAAALALVHALRSQSPQRGSLQPSFMESVRALLNVGAWPLERAERTTLALVGPTGVGKTTTAAKLAAHAVSGGRKVLLLAGDPHRVAAHEQLRRFGEALGVRVEAVRSRRDVAEALRTATEDLIILDTAGRASVASAPESLLGPETFARAGLSEHWQRRVMLCMPASVRAHDATRAARTFGLVGPTDLAITKLDETDRPAGVLHASYATGLPVSVLCNGPRVPEDVSPATLETLSTWLTPAGRNRDGRR